LNIYFFRFITFESAAEANAAFEERPHTIDETGIETKRATPREEMNKEKSSSGSGSGAADSETHRKLFIGGLNYTTTDEILREYFTQYGELVDCVVMKFRDTKRSRGFGFVTYATLEQVDECQKHRPHTIEDTKVETKRATPREEVGRGGDSSSGQTVKKVFLGGLKDGVSDDDIRDYMTQFGSVLQVEQMTDKSTGRKRGFGFVEFDDYDPVDKLMLKSNHIVNGYRIDVKKAISKTEMNMGGGGGGGRGGDRGGPRQNPAPWNSGNDYNNDGYGGGYGGGNRGNQSYGGGNQGGGFGGGNQGWGGGQPNPWGDNNGGGGAGGGNDAGYGGGSGGGNSGWGGDSGWGGNSGWTDNNDGGGGGGGGGYGGGYSTGGSSSGGNFGGGGGGGGGARGMGGPMRSSNQVSGGGYRTAPYSVGNRGGSGVQGGGGSGGGYSRGGGQGGSAGGGSRW
jgi:heterogeneous nuclear ribonucleoprotein A1/A3